jgi:hypothetical protein
MIALYEQQLTIETKQATSANQRFSNQDSVLLQSVRNASTTSILNPKTIQKEPCCFAPRVCVFLTN